MGEFRLDRKTKFYGQDGALVKEVRYIHHMESTAFEKEILIVSLIDQPPDANHPYYSFFSYIPISILV